MQSLFDYSARPRLSAPSTGDAPEPRTLPPPAASFASPPPAAGGAGVGASGGLNFGLTSPSYFSRGLVAGSTALGPDEEDAEIARDDFSAGALLLCVRALHAALTRRRCTCLPPPPRPPPPTPSSPPPPPSNPSSLSNCPRPCTSPFALFHFCVLNSSKSRTNPPALSARLIFSARQRPNCCSRGRFRPALLARSPSRPSPITRTRFSPRAATSRKHLSSGLHPRRRRRLRAPACRTTSAPARLSQRTAAARPSLAAPATEWRVGVMTWAAAAAAAVAAGADARRQWGAHRAPSLRRRDHPGRPPPLPCIRRGLSRGRRPCCPRHGRRARRRRGLAPSRALFPGAAAARPRPQQSRSFFRRRRRRRVPRSARRRCRPPSARPPPFL
jgi:hypothetical protein